MKPSRQSALFLLSAILAAAWLSSSLLFGGSFTAAVETIHTHDLRKHCEVLASDTLEGRETGTRGGQAAGAYLVATLRKQKNVRPAGIDGDYFQPFLPNSRNVLAVLPGSDPSLKSDYVIVGAHYDHVGYGSPRNSRGPIGYIHNGADDNASGSAALLELIDAFSSLDVAPRRSLLFIFWDGEEKGLLGSQYWISSPTVPLERVRLVFNIDMIGRLRQNRADVFGCRSAPGLRQLLASQNVETPVSLNFLWETRRDSDHYNFYAHQIPYLMVFTGKHEDYHTPYDDVQKLNVEGMERLTRLLFRAVYAACQQPALPAFRPAAFQETGQAQAEAEVSLSLPSSRLGVTWDEEQAKQNVIRLVDVDAGSAAQAAGLQAGDRIIGFDGTTIRTPDDLRAAVFSAGERTNATIERTGEKTPRTLDVRLAPSTDRVGLSCRADEAEPGCAIVNRVLPGSPAQRAGVRLNDRILRVGGTAFQSLPELQDCLARQAGPFDVRLEREGEPHVVRLDVRGQTARR